MMARSLYGQSAVTPSSVKLGMTKRSTLLGLVYLPQDAFIFKGRVLPGGDLPRLRCKLPGFWPWELLLKTGFTFSTSGLSTTLSYAYPAHDAEFIVAALVQDQWRLEFEASC